jgi:chitinase
MRGSSDRAELILLIGGWSFNDPGPTATTFSDLAGSSSAQQTFFASLTTFLINNGYSGVDIDWLGSLFSIHIWIWR